MAIALDVYTAASGTSSWSHTCTGSDIILLVGAYALSDTVSSVTYNGVSMTLIGKTTFPGSGRQGAYLYYLINPATGSHTVSVTGGTGIGSASYTGAKQTGQPDSSNTGTQTGTAITMTTTVVASNCWLVGVEADPNGGETAGAGTTIRGTDGNGLVFADSNGVVGTGSQSLVVNHGNGASAWVVASIAPAASGGGETADTLMLGHFA